MKFAVAIALVACFAAANAEPRRLQVAGLVDLDEPTKSEAHRMTKWFAWKTVSCAAEDMGNQLATQASWQRTTFFILFLLLRPTNVLFYIPARMFFFPAPRSPHANV